MNDRTPDPTALPRDTFSTALRSLTGNPGAVRSTSTVTVVDLLGNSETWVIDTFRVEGEETVLLQRINSVEGTRMVLPPQVTSVLARQRDRATTVNRKRGARAAIATRIARGDTIGNPSALLKARRAKTARRNK